MNDLAKLMMNRISGGLKRTTITTCSKWAEAYRIMGKPSPGPWRFKYHPWLKEMHDSKAEINVGQKAAQMGFTETVLNITFFNIDVLGTDCLYVLPAKTPDAKDFSVGRFDPALELSPHLQQMFSDVKNVGHKRAGSNNLYIRGSRSESGLKSIPVGLIVLDEVEEMNQKNIPLALERASGQFSWQAWLISTPKFFEMGINSYYKDTTQEHFFFKCPHCSRQIELKFPDSFVICGESSIDPKIHDSHIICYECKAKLDHETKWEYLSTGTMVPSYTQREMRGFHVNQLYSSMIKPGRFIKTWFEAQIDPAAEEEFFHSKLGTPHEIEGARISDADIQQCINSQRHTVTSQRSGFVTMGVDVGKVLHIVIKQWQLPRMNTTSIDLNVQARSQVIWEGKVTHFEELDRIMQSYNTRMCVIDANPERRKAMEFAKRFPGMVYQCFYGSGIQGKQIHVRETEFEITVDRTSWLDMTLGRYRSKTTELPADVSLEFKRHLKALVRSYEKDRDGNPIGRYVKKDSEADHFAHADNYAEIALPLAATIATNRSIGSVL